MPPDLASSRTLSITAPLSTRLDHVVDRERRDAGRRQRFHLDAGLPARLRRGDDADRVALRRSGSKSTSRLGQRDRMAERDQLGRLLGRHDAGDARRRQHVALGRVAARHRRRRLPADSTMIASALASRSVDGLVGDIDHARRALVVQMGELAHALAV